MESRRPETGAQRQAGVNPTGRTRTPARIGDEAGAASATDSVALAQEQTALPEPSVAFASLPESGSILGKYRLDQPIGMGSSCIVYRAHHVKLPVTVAVKIPRLAEVENTAALREQLRTEAALLAHLNHPNILRLWDYDDDPFPYLVVEFVQGFTLGQVMRTHAAKRPEAGGRPTGTLLPTTWVLQMAYHLVKGLKAALQMGIIHRDLKPENIMVTDDGLVKVADLGLGAVIGNRLLRGVASVSSQGHITGTAAYVAPEQACNADEADHRADVYSLGATLYHALAGQLPFTGRSAMEVILKHINEPARPLTQVVPGIKREVSALVQKMLAKKPQDRHQTYEELAAHIRHALSA